MIVNLIAKFEESYHKAVALQKEQQALIEKHGSQHYRIWPDKADEMRIRCINKQLVPEYRLQLQLEEQISKILGGRYYILPDGRHVSCYLDSDYGVCIQILKPHEG